MKRGGKRKLSSVGAASENLPPSYKEATAEEKPSLVNATAKDSGDDRDLVSAAEALTQLTQLNSNINSSSASLNSRLSTPPITSNMNGVPAGSSGLPAAVASNFLIEKSAVLPPIQQQHPLVAKVNKVSKHPLVTNAVKYYDYSKRNYAPFNYAAEFVEKAALPMVNKIEVNLNNRYQAKREKEARKGTVKKRRRVTIQQRTEAISSPSLSPSPTPRSQPSFGPSASYNSFGSSLNRKDTNVSIETKKRLQFCLHILKLANEKINNLVLVLQQRVVTKEMEAKEKREAASVADIKLDETQKTNTEIVTTVKNIIRLISNFKPSSLATSEELKEIVIDEKSGVAAPVNSRTTSITSSRRNSTDDDKLKGTIRDIILALPATIQQSSNGNTQTNDRVLVFAKESLDMISRLTLVFNNQLEKAEAWVAGEQEEANEGKLKTSIIQEKVLREDDLDSGCTSESTTDGENPLAGFGCR